MVLSEEVELSLKVMVNKDKNKVLFAEADADFADVLLSFMTLPLGTIVRLMRNHYGLDAPIIGSLTTMFKSLYDLGEGHFSSWRAKEMLIYAESSFIDECSNLKINVDSYHKPATKYYRCGDADCSRKRPQLISRYYDLLKCDCGEYMNKPIDIARLKNRDDGDDNGVFVKKVFSFLITDDLRMAPLVPGCMIQTLLDLGVSIPNGAQQLIVSFGLRDIMDLLKACLVSSTPLTDVVFHQQDTVKADDVIGNFLRHTMKDSSVEDSKKMTVKAWVYKYGCLKNELFLLEVGEDFVDFFLSLLVIPLGGVEWILGGNTGLRNIDNLYRSVKDFIDDNCFRTSEMKSRLMNPKLPPNYLSKNQFMFALEEEVNPKVCYFESDGTGDSSEETGSWVNFKDPKGGESYVKSSATFVVSDGFLESRGSEVMITVQQNHSYYKELELHIGSKEAFNILKASLTSVLALRDSLSNVLSEKLTT